MCPRNCSHPVVGRLREVSYTYLLAVSISLASRAVAPSRPSRSYQLGQPAALPVASKAQPCRPYLALSTVLTREIVPRCRLNSRPSGGRLCSLVGPGVLSVPGSCGRLPRMPANAGPGADPDTCTKPGLNLGRWPAPMPAPSGVCTAGRKRVSFSQLCGGRAPAGSVRSPAVLSDGGACGVAAVCRRPVKDPPRQFGERAFAGFPWVPASGRRGSR